MKDAEITSEHTHARITQVLEEIEALRLEMGRARDARVAMDVREASPREVFYHAQTAHRKANQLCVELGADSVAPPGAAEPARAQPADVLRVLDSIRERLARARVHLHLEHDDYLPDLPGPLGRHPGKEASDVLSGCLIASRQLNVMLAKAFTSREGHERLLRALGIMERLLELHGVDLPPPPPLERRKSPRDAFEVMWPTCDVLHRMMTDSGLHALELRRGYVGEEPSDVHDLASLIVSELEYVASFTAIKQRPIAAPATPNPTLPAHNVRRARQLQTAMNSLAAAVKKKPDWLKTLSPPPTGDIIPH